MECVVYHKHLKGMDTSDGYIGISKNFDDRMDQHYREAHVRGSIYTVHENMRKYGDDVITTIIFEGTVQECFDYEEELRPRWNMGWNMAIGGGRPGSGWKPGQNWLDNRLWHPEHGEVQVSKDNTLADIGAKYFPEMNRGNFGGGFSRILNGKLINFHGWELANAQLVEKLKTRYYQEWEEVFIKKEDSVVRLHKTGFKAFAAYLGISPKLLNIKMVIVGACTKCRGYELATEEEWLNTTERLVFK